jgi:hypothetical protein
MIDRVNDMGWGSCFANLQHSHSERFSPVHLWNLQEVSEKRVGIVVNKPSW